MKTAIIGAGAIGALFGSLLKTNNIDAVLYDTDKAKTDYIGRNGIQLIYPGTGGKTTIFPEAVSDINRVKFCDYYLICVKSYATEEAVKTTASAAGENSVIVTFQNGMGNVEKIQKYFPDTQIAAGTTSEGATLIPPGTVIYGGKGKTALSMIGAEPANSRLIPLIDAFNSSSIETDITDNYRKDIWKKLIINAAINPVTAVLGLKNKYISGSPYLRNLSEIIIKESVKAAESEGINLDYNEIRETVFAVAEKTGENRSSMLQDIDNKRKTEIDYISGAAADKAEEAGIQSPANRIMQNIIKVLESRYFT